MSIPRNKTKRSQAGSGEGITVPEWDALFGKPPVIDPDAKTGAEIRKEYRMAAGECWKMIYAMLKSGELEEVKRESPSGRLVKAYRPTKKGGGK